MFFTYFEWSGKIDKDKLLNPFKVLMLTITKKDKEKSWPIWNRQYCSIKPWCSTSPNSTREQFDTSIFDNKLKRRILYYQKMVQKMDRIPFNNRWKVQILLIKQLLRDLECGGKFKHDNSPKSLYKGICICPEFSVRAHHLNITNPDLNCMVEYLTWTL